eukprot:3767200-Pyramimonas_sp.AAC.1
MLCLCIFNGRICCPRSLAPRCKIAKRAFLGALQDSSTKCGVRKWCSPKSDNVLLQMGKDGIRCLLQAQLGTLLHVVAKELV